MKSFFRLAAIAALTTIFSCKKEQSTTPTIDPPSTACTATIYGFHINNYIGATSGAISSFDPATGVATTIGNVSANVYGSGGSIDISNGIYYLTADSPSYFPRLYKVPMAGGIPTVYTYPDNLIGIAGYNNYTHQLMGVKRGSTDSLAVITLGSGTFSYNCIAALPGGLTIGFSIDNATGTAFYNSFDMTTSMCSIGRISPGASAGTLLVSGIPGAIRGMCHNSNDNKLYYRYWDGDTATITTRLVSIPATGGTPTVVATMHEKMNGDFQTSCIDACHNRYIIATMAYDSATTSYIEDSSTVYQYNMSGTLVQRYNIPGVYGGIAVKY